MKRVGQLYRENLANHIKEGVDSNQSLFMMSYSQVSGMQMSELRKDLQHAGANMFVSKNRIARIALKNLKQEDLAAKLTGQTAFVWSNADSVEISKVLMKFAKDLEKVTIYGGLLEGVSLEQEDIKKLSELPSREVLVATLLATIQAPLTRFAGALIAKSRELLSILKQLSEKKGGN
jgi:large subunit ribosomal protein L10